MRKVKRILSLFLAIALTLTMFSAVSAPTVEAKTKVKTKTISLTMYVGESVQLGDNDSWLTSKAKTSNKNVVKVSNKKPCKYYYRAILTAKKAGKANITYNMYYYTKKSKKVNYKIKAKITVKKKVPTPTVAKYTVAVDEDGECYFDVKWKQTKELKEFKKNRSIKKSKYETILKVDGKTVEYGNSTLFSYFDSDVFGYYDVYRVTGNTKMNWYGREGCVLTKINTVFEMHKEGGSLFVNDKLTNQDSDDVMMFNENGESVYRAFDKNGGPLYDNLWDEAKARNLIVSTGCGVYECADGHDEYYKTGDIIKVRSWNVPTSKEIASYIQAHPERFEITVKPVSVTFRWIESTKCFPVYVPSAKNIKYTTLKY